MPLPWIGLGGLWLVWWLSWWAAARWSGPTVAAAPKRDEMRYRLLTVVGAALLFVPLFSVFRPFAAATALYATSPGLTWICAVLAAIGFGFCWWARLHLGRLWSASIVRKDDHRIVDTGPYGLVRHPIYTGIILAGLATGIAQGTAIAFAGVAVFALSFYVKARLEEQFLRQQLGAEAYAAYSARVPMLVPFWPFG